VGVPQGGGAGRPRREPHWRVLRWLPGENEPTLAAEGDLLAIGVPLTRSRMAVSVVDVRSGRTRARFDTPAGYLSFASPTRLVLAMPRTLSVSGGPAAETTGPYGLALFTTAGRRVANLGDSTEPPLVSGMHLVSVDQPEGAGSFGQPIVSVRDLRHPGAPQPLIAFAPPARELVASALRWPALALLVATSAPRLPSELTCWGEDYGPPRVSPRLFDLARPEPFLPAPPIVRVQPATPLECKGPPPP
jgi:hypothetical protein